MKSTSTLILSVVLVLAIVGFAIFAIVAGGKISNNENSINTLEKNVTTLQTALNGSNGDIATLKGQISAANTQITTLQGQVTSDAAKLTTAQAQVTSATSQISTLQGQITALQTQGNSQDGQIAAANASVTALQTTVTSLQSTVTSLQTTVNNLQYTGGTSSFVILTNTPTMSVANTPVQIGYFTPTVAGTQGVLTVSGYSTTAGGYVYVYNGYGNSATVALPTSQGTVYVYFTNYTGTNYLMFSNASVAATAYITSVTRLQ